MKRIFATYSMYFSSGCDRVLRVLLAIPDPTTALLLLGPGVHHDDQHLRVSNIWLQFSNIYPHIYFKKFGKPMFSMKCREKTIFIIRNIPVS